MRNPKAAVSDPNEFVSDPGSRIHTLYSSKVLKNGIIELTPSGSEDIQEKIDSYRDSTDMAFIIHHLLAGDESVLYQKSAMYGDFTKAPESLAEAQQMLIDGEAAFMQLPLETRQKFDNNFRAWLFQAGSEGWIKAMQPVTDSGDLQNPVEDVNPAVEEKEVI